MKILVIDDEPELRMVLGDFLGANHTVVEASHGVEALEIFHKESKTEPFDLIITDLMMPKMNGLDFAKEVRETDTAIPIVVISAHIESFDLGSYKEFFTDIRVKPVNLHKLAELIDSFGKEKSP